MFEKVKAFFAFLATGLLLVLFGTLLRMFDSLEKYIEDHDRKEPIAQKERMSVGKPEKNWVRYISGKGED